LMSTRRIAYSHASVNTTLPIQQGREVETVVVVTIAIDSNGRLHQETISWLQDNTERRACIVLRASPHTTRRRTRRSCKFEVLAVVNSFSLAGRGVVAAAATSRRKVAHVGTFSQGGWSASGIFCGCLYLLVVVADGSKARRNCCLWFLLLL
jgi:hypothetical protein